MSRIESVWSSDDSTIYYSRGDALLTHDLWKMVWDGSKQELLYGEPNRNESQPDVTDW